MVSQGKPDQYDRPFVPAGTANVNTSVLTADQYRQTSSTLLWKWNETDVSQFSSTIVQPSYTTNLFAVQTMAGYSSSVTFLPYQTSIGKGPRIEFSHTTVGGASTGVHAFFVTDPACVLPRRFILRVGMSLDNTAGTGAWNFGPFFHNGGTNATFFGYGLLMRNDALNSTVSLFAAGNGTMNAGVSGRWPFGDSGATPNGVALPNQNINNNYQPGMIYDIEVYSDITTPGNTIQPNIHGNILGGQNTGGVTLSHFTATPSQLIGTNGAVYPGSPAWTSRANDLTRLGFAIRLITQGAALRRVRVHDLAVYKHPMDY